MSTKTIKREIRKRDLQLSTSGEVEFDLDGDLRDAVAEIGTDTAAGIPRDKFDDSRGGWARADYQGSRIVARYSEKYGRTRVKVEDR